jgi:hypothetical protein
MATILLSTIGFTKHSASAFFTKLKEAGIVRVIDIRLNNVSQLAGFTKRDDLIYFLKEICGCGYIHEPCFAPTQEILDAWKKRRSTGPHMRSASSSSWKTAGSKTGYLRSNCTTHACCAASRRPRDATAGWSPSTFKADSPAYRYVTSSTGPGRPAISFVLKWSRDCRTIWTGERHRHRPAPIGTGREDENAKE